MLSRNVERTNGPITHNVEETLTMDIARVSACTFPLIERPLEEALRVVAEAGFEKVDLLGRAPHFSPDPLECNPDDVKGAADAAGLRIASLGTYVGGGFFSEEPSEQEDDLAAVHRAVDAAVLFGARAIRVLRVPREYDDPELIDRVIPLLRQAAEYASDSNIRMGIENHGGRINGNIDLLKDLFEKVGSRYFGLIYDPCNSHTHGTDYREGLAALREHVVHVHFKDARATSEGVQLTMLGEGDIDFRWIGEQLDEAGYDGDFALEYELKEEAPDTGLKRWLEAYLAL